jgi:cytochrome c oxidase assembly protein subunit 15
MRRLRTISPEGYARVSLVALLALTAIVATGAAVRLTGSGLGCPDWPKCHGSRIAPSDFHGMIEYGNRLFSALVTVAAIAAAVLARRRRPYRRDLARIASLLPVGVIAQAALGALTVRYHLNPGLVMTHFAVSMLVLAAAVALAWRARFPPGERPQSNDRRMVWAVRGLVPLGALTIFAGTVATAAGPHPGANSAGHPISRLDFRGAGTLRWAIDQHARIATALGVAAVALWLWQRRRSVDPTLRRALTVVPVAIALQGAVGELQYRLHLPSELVWVHVVFASLVWLSILAATASAGRLAPRTAEHRDAVALET